MKDNRTKGFSMIELIIVIAIIGIMTAMATLGFGYIQSGNVRAAANSIVADLSQMKYDAMSKQDKQFMYIYKVGGKYYSYCSASEVTNPSSVLTASNGTSLCNSNCKITYDGGIELAPGNYITIAYKKSGGLSSKSSFTRDISDITVSKADGSGKYVITIYKETGKHTLSHTSS